MYILWRSRIVIPPQGHSMVLSDTHQGSSKMKALRRSYVWWPGMDAEIENLVKSCSTCQENRPSPPAAPLHSWEWPSEPWSCLHLDFAGSF